MASRPLNARGLIPLYLENSTGTDVQKCLLSRYNEIRAGYIGLPQTAVNIRPPPWLLCHRLAKYTPPLVIFDMGTATTLSVIDKDGCYVGGMIIPGLRLSVDALSARAAQLPYINLDDPEHLIGTNTISCMQSGAIYSNAAMIDGLLERVEEELGQPVTAVATGGLMSTVLPYCKRAVHFDENLMLEGLSILYRKNFVKREKR